MTKLDDLAVKVRACMDRTDATQVDCLYEFTTSLLVELKPFVEREEGKTIPEFIFKRCNDAEFQEFLAEHNRIQFANASAVAYQDKFQKIVAVNLERVSEALGMENPTRTFAFNLTLPLIEELVHLINPKLTEAEVNEIDVRLGEKFLEYTIPDEQRKEMQEAVKGN